MNKKVITMSLMICIALALPSSSFFLNNFLTQQITKQLHSKAQLDFALSMSNKAALKHAWHEAEKYSENWLYLTKELAKTQGDAAYQLGTYFQHKQEDNKAVTWFERAVRLNFPPAFIALAQYYFNQNDLDKSAEILHLLPKNHSQATSIQAEVIKLTIAISQGNLSYVRDRIVNYRPILAQSDTGRKLLADIRKYQVLFEPETQQLNLQGKEEQAYCPNSVQFFATNFTHLKQLEAQINLFKQHQMAKFICFLPVRYLPIDLLQCQGEKDQAITCNEQKWASIANSIASRFVGLMLPKGGANVYFGALYIDAQDNLDVLIHEIAHLLGFVDEYPLAETHVKCQSPQDQAFSENIAILAKSYQGSRQQVRSQVLTQLPWAGSIKKTTEILQAVKHQNNGEIMHWQLGSPDKFNQEIGVFPAQTCSKQTQGEVDKNSLSAFKPIASATKMQYFSLAFPQSYFTSLKHSQGRYLMPSFHYNIALAYFNLGNINQAHYWLSQSLKWETSKARKDKLRQGAF